MLRKLYINVGKIQFVELLQTTIDSFIAKKEENKRLSISIIFIKVVKNQMRSREQKKEVVVTKGVNLKRRSKKIKKSERKTVKKEKRGNSVKEIAKRSKGHNIFASLAGEESMEEEE